MIILLKNANVYLTAFLVNPNVSSFTNAGILRNFGLSRIAYTYFLTIFVILHRHILYKRSDFIVNGYQNT